MTTQFLVHDKRDTVGVAVVDVKAGQALEGGRSTPTRPSRAKANATSRSATRSRSKDFKVGDTVIKYGCDIGKVVAADQGRRPRARPQRQDQDGGHRSNRQSAGTTVQ